MERRSRNYGFAFLIFVALSCASYLASSADVPEPVPEIAIRSPEIYRLEIATAFSVAFYLATMAMVLALRGEGFAEFGARGMRATPVIGPGAREQQEASSRQLKLVDEAERRMEELTADLKSLREKVDSQQVRLEEL